LLIPLSQGKFAIIDDEDWDLVKGYKWYAKKHENTFYAVTNIRKPDGKYKKLCMHRLLLDLKKGEICDHINHNGCDNRRSDNIRKATKQQNEMNKTKRKNCSSIYKGVYFDKIRERYRVQICFNKKKISLGAIKTELEGALLYDLKAKELFGEYACLNFPTKS